MKKIITLMITIALASALVACGGWSITPAPAPSPEPAPAPVQEPVPDDSNAKWNPDNIREQRFVLAHGQRETGMTGLQYHEFAAAVEELSGGLMTVEEKAGASLLSDTEAFSGMMDGRADFVHSIGSYAADTVTDILPMTITGYYGGNDWLGFFNNSRGLIEGIFGENGVKYIGALYQGDTVIICSEKQIKSPSDVKGLVFCATDIEASKTIELWGGVTVTVGLADLAGAFSNNAVKGMATGLNIIVPYRIFEVAQYITTTSIAEGFAALLMNGGRWDSLNADEQALITEAGMVFEQNSYGIAKRFMDAYMEEVRSLGLNEVYELTSAEQREFVDLAFSQYPQMEPELSAKGIELIGLLKRENGIL